MFAPTKRPVIMVALLATTFLIFFSSMQVSGWHLMKLFGAWGGGRFLDTKQVLHWVDCYGNIGNAIYSNSGACSGYIYGKSLISGAHLLRIHEHHLMQVGFLLIILLSFSLAWILITASRRVSWKFAGLTLLSPPILLLAERGNFDILILFLLILSAWTYQNNLQVLGILFLALASILKFYVFPIFIVYFIYCSKKWNKVLLTVVATLVLARIILDLRLIESSFPKIWGAQFGMSVWLRYAERVGYFPSEMVIQLTGLILFVALFFSVKRLKLGEPYKQAGSPEKEFYFIVFFGTHLSCFILGMSFDYRLVFLITSALFFIKSSHKEIQPNLKIVYIMTLLSSWLVYESWVLQIAGDLATELLTAIFLVRFLETLLVRAGLRK